MLERMSNKSDVTDPAVARNSPLSFEKFSIISKENIIVWRPENYYFFLGIFPITGPLH